MPKSLLKSKVRNSVFPYLERLGFKESSSRELALGGVSRTTYPFGTWTRYNSDFSVDLIEFKFNKFGYAKFEFNFAKIQKNGGYGTYEFHTQDDGVASGIGEYGRYRPKKFTTSSPISLSFSKRYLQNENIADKAIQQWISGLIQVENWFQNRIVGSFLVTFENLPRGVRISRGFPSAVIFKTTSVRYVESTKDNIFGENNVTSYEEAISVAENYYNEMGKTLNLTRRLWYKYDGC